MVNRTTLQFLKLFDSIQTNSNAIKGALTIRTIQLSMILWSLSAPFGSLTTRNSPHLGDKKPETAESRYSTRHLRYLRYAASNLLPQRRPSTSFFKSFSLFFQASPSEQCQSIYQPLTMQYLFSLFFTFLCLSPVLALFLSKKGWSKSGFQAKNDAGF